MNDCESVLLEIITFTEQKKKQLVYNVFTSASFSQLIDTFTQSKT